MTNHFPKLRNAGPLITAQTGWDEAVIVGTEAELLAFADKIKQAVANAKTDEFFGEPTKTSAFAGEVGQYSELQFDWLVVTQDDDQTMRLSMKIDGESS